MTCDRCERVKAIELESTGQVVDYQCLQCEAKANGWKCSSCGSPWIYTRVHGSHYDDGESRLLCRPCTYTLINAKGLDHDL